MVGALYFVQSEQVDLRCTGEVWRCGQGQTALLLRSGLRTLLRMKLDVSVMQGPAGLQINICISASAGWPVCAMDVLRCWGLRRLTRRPDHC